MVLYNSKLSVNIINRALKYIQVIKGYGAGAPTGAAPPQTGGGGVAGSTYGSRYGHVGMGTAIPVRSAAFAQPLPALAVVVFPPETMVKVGAGSVTMEPVGAYEGKFATGPAFVICAGGHGIVLDI